MPDPVPTAAEIAATEAATAATVAAEKAAAEAAEEKHEGFIDLVSHQKDVNVQHKRFRDEERGRIKEQTRADGLQTQLDEIKGQQAEVVVPAVPDPDSTTYAEDVKARDEAITALAEQNAAKETAAAQRKAKDEARVTEQNAAVGERVAAFDKNMVGHGLDSAETKIAVDSIIGYGISVDFQDVLLEDPDGPLFAQYLHQNPMELDAMKDMSTYQLVNHLNGDIRAKALLLKPKTSGAPDPPIVLDGGGAPETKESWEKGAKYE